MNFGVFFIVMCALLSQTSTLHNPFSIESQEQYYKSQYSELKKMTVLSLHSNNNPSFSITIGGKFLEKLNISKKNGNLRVKIYPSVHNPQITEKKKIITIKAICEFSYPITVAGGNGKYQCSLGYKDKSEQTHSIGTCKLTIQYKLSSCLIIGSVDMDQLSNIRNVLLEGNVYHDGFKLWSVTNTSLIHPLVSWDYLIWMRTFAKSSLNIEVLIGIPRNPINTSTIFELPVKLKRDKNNERILEILLQVTYSRFFVLEDVRSLTCFQASEPRIFEEAEAQLAEIKIRRDDTDQCSPGDRDVLLILQMSAKENAKQLSIQILIDSINYADERDVHNATQGQKTTIKLPMFQGTTTIIPVVKNPIILPNFTKHSNPYQIQASDLRIYYLYDDIHFADVSLKVQCRPFDNSRLQCPASMQKLAPVYTSVDNPDSMQWSLELMVDGLVFVIKMEPLLRPDDQWTVKFPDSVLNLISGWKAVRRGKYSSLISDVKCEPMYQVAPILIFKKLLVHDQESNETTEMIADLSDRVKYRNIRLSSDIAVVLKSEKSLVIQGFSSGNLDVELLTYDGSVLIKSSMTVYNEPVTVVDLDISCIYGIKLSAKIPQSSNSIFIGDLQFQYENVNNSRSCFFIIEVMFSDKSHTNIWSFHKDQYSLRFVTNKNIFNVVGVDDMWYDWEKFDRATMFHVELLESNFCVRPRTIFRKQVQLGPRTKETTFSSVTIIEMGNGTTSEFLKSASTNEPNIVKKVEGISAKSLKSLTFILIAVISVILIIVIVNILIRCLRAKKFSSCHSNRRKSINGDVIILAPNDKDYPPLLPPPGPQVQLSDSASVTISSPHSFWCLDPSKPKRPTPLNAFVRQSSLPVKGRLSRVYSEIAPCPPLRWANKMVPSDNTYDSDDGLNSGGPQEMISCSPMTWSVTHMDVEESSGVGSLNTNMDDMIKDPYGSQERFHKLSELQSPQNGTKEHIYDMV